MYMFSSSSLIMLNSDVLETNLLNLIVVIIAIGVLIQQYSTSLIYSYQDPLLETVSEYYDLEKAIEELENDRTEILALLLRVFLNAQVITEYSTLELKAFIFIRVYGMYEKIQKFKEKAIREGIEEVYQQWLLDIDDAIFVEISIALFEPEDQQKVVHRAIAELESEDFEWPDDLGKDSWKDKKPGPPNLDGVEPAPPYFAPPKTEETQD